MNGYEWWLYILIINTANMVIFQSSNVLYIELFRRHHRRVFCPGGFAVPNCSNGAMVDALVQGKPLRLRHRRYSDFFPIDSDF
jgi:hypothetical protein